ncbi:MAG: FtsX-like permease family protein [Bacteroidota bacterium]
MLINYFKLAYRNLNRYKFISFINLFGLTVGLTCCLLILVYILNEINYDKSNGDADRIYRVTRTFYTAQTGATTLQLSGVAPPIGPLLQNDFKEIEKITRVLQNGITPLSYEEKKFNELDVYWADENFFDFFKVAVTEGNLQKALNDPYSIMISEKMATKYFGDEEPMNKILKMSNQYGMKVTGVFKSFPENMHFHPDILLSFSTLNDTAIYGAENLRTNWGNNSFYTYLLFPKNYNAKNFEAQMPAFLDRHFPMDGAPATFNPHQFTSLALQKLTDIHLLSHMDDEMEENGDINRVYIFSAIALFILLIACINYMNLSTARSTLRAREIGLRKVVGAQRKEIISQFLSESVLLTGVSMILAMVLTWITLPWLNKVSGQQLSIGILINGKTGALLLLIPFLVGIISGIYPALFMSSFRPITVLKSAFRIGSGNISFRKILVTAQFAISIILIIGTAIIFKQMGFMQNTSLGFDKEHIVNLPYTTALNGKFDAFRNELLSESGIKNTGRSSRIPSGRLLDAMGAMVMRGDSLQPANADMKYVAADQDFISTYGVEIVAGRGFSKNFTTDTSAFLINETAVKVLGFNSNEDAIGQSFGYGGRRGKLTGVFHDFHFESMHQRIVPLVILIPRSETSFGEISIKISGADIPSALAHIEKTWKKFLPETPYQFNFLDENFARLYQSEQRQATLFTVFACITIFIACLGLFGLSAFAISQRVKEIGIRKVLGANARSIVLMLSKDFLLLVLLAAIIAFPVAWYFMNQWLQDFAYRINMPWWIFGLSAIMASAVAFGTISIQAVKAANSNPVKSLRAE